MVGVGSSGAPMSCLGSSRSHRAAEVAERQCRQQSNPFLPHPRTRFPFFNYCGCRQDTLESLHLVVFLASPAPLCLVRPSLIPCRYQTSLFYLPFTQHSLSSTSPFKSVPRHSHADHHRPSMPAAAPARGGR
jgi:hypothetical protein